MPRISRLRAGLPLLIALSIASCSDDDDTPDLTVADAGAAKAPGTTGDAGTDSAVADIDGARPDAAGPDAANAHEACLDRPESLARPPTGALPCELLPPGR